MEPEASQTKVIRRAFPRCRRRGLWDRCRRRRGFRTWPGVRSHPVAAATAVTLAAADSATTACAAHGSGSEDCRVIPRPTAAGGRLKVHAFLISESVILRTRINILCGFAVDVSAGTDIGDAAWRAVFDDVGVRDDHLLFQRHLLNDLVDATKVRNQNAGMNRQRRHKRKNVLHPRLLPEVQYRAMRLILFLIGIGLTRNGRVNARNFAATAIFEAMGGPGGPALPGAVGTIGGATGFMPGGVGGVGMG